MKQANSRPSIEFRVALDLISRIKSWSKWQKPISQSAYEKICSDARAAIAAFGFSEYDYNFFVIHFIDHYLKNGFVNPDFQGEANFAGLFAALRRQIDTAIQRRYRAMLSAAKRRKAQNKPSVDAPTPPSSSLLHGLVATSKPADISMPRPSKSESRPKSKTKAAKKSPQAPKSKPSLSRHPSIRGLKIRRPAPAAQKYPV